MSPNFNGLKVEQEQKEIFCEKLGEMLEGRTRLVNLDAEDLAWDVFAFFEDNL